MAYIVMACIVMAYIVTAYIVMAYHRELAVQGERLDACFDEWFGHVSGRRAASGSKAEGRWMIGGAYGYGAHGYGASRYGSCSHGVGRRMAVSLSVTTATMTTAARLYIGIADGHGRCRCRKVRIVSSRINGAVDARFGCIFWTGFGQTRGLKTRSTETHVGHEWAGRYRLPPQRSLHTARLRVGDADNVGTPSAMPTQSRAVHGLRSRFT